MSPCNRYGSFWSNYSYNWYWCCCPPSGILASGFTDQLKRRQAQYENELSKALQDGFISSSERNKLTKIARDMNLSEDQIKTMEKN